MPFVPDAPGKFSPDTPSQTPNEESGLDSFLSRLQGATGLGPMGLMPGIMGARLLAEGVNKGMEKIGDIAYGAGEKVTDITQSPLAGYAANVGVQAVPMLAGGAVAKTFAPALEAGARKLMGSAAKPTLDQWKSGEAKRAIDTLFAEGLNPTEGGVEVLKKKISTINDEIAKTIAGSTETVKVGDTGKPLLDALKRFERQVAPQDDLAAIERTWSMYRNHPALGGRTDMPVQLAQELKQGTYRQIDKKYGELGTAETEAQKAIARGLKEEIAAKVPEIAPLNAKESELINTLNVIERRAMLDLNKNPMSLALLAHNPSSFVAFMADKSAFFKSLVARMLNAGKEQIPATTTRLGVAGYEAAQPQGPR